jgi:hypothetical protein
MEARQSTFVTVVAWIFIIQSGFSAFVLFLEGLVFAVVFNSHAFAEKLPPNAPPITGAVLHVMIYFMFALCLFALFALSASIGLLRRRNWARLSFVGLLGFAIFWIVLNLIFQIGMAFFTPTPHVPQAQEAHSIMTVFAGFMSVLGIALIVLFAWIIRRLVTDPIRQEFLPHETDAVKM